MFISLTYWFRVRLTPRWLPWLFALLIVFLLFLGSATEWLQAPLPRITHTLRSSTQHVNTLWVRQDVSTYPIASAGGRMFAMSLDGNSLIATDMMTGATVWQDGLSFDHSHPRGLLANQTTVFVIPTLSVDAYDAKTGQFKWSAPLGQGHVTIISQLDSGVVRVYYGDTIYELDSETGKVLATMPKANIVWVSRNIVLKTSISNQYLLSAYDRQTGALIWNQGPQFFVDEPCTPRTLNKDILIVAESSSWSSVGGICALNLQEGKYDWCRPENFNGMAAVDAQSELGYAIRDDLTLLTVDLQTGNIVGQTSFLSSEPFDKRNGWVSTVTANNGNVVVSFHDSFQTFGLEFLP